MFNVYPLNLKMTLLELTMIWRTNRSSRTSFQYSHGGAIFSCWYRDDSYL